MTPIPMIVAAVLLVLAGPAGAQEKADRRAALAAAQAMIVKADAAGIFTAGAWDYGPTAKHERSGMNCRFVMAATTNTVSVYDPEPTRGEDVGCSTNYGGVLASHFASRASLVGGFDAVTEGSLKALVARVGTVVPYTGEVFEMKAAALPSIRIHRLVTEQSGAKFYERIAVMDMGEWIITQRFTALLEAAPAADRLAAMSLALMAKDMQASAKPSR